MSEVSQPSSSRDSRHLHQQHKLAKDLIRAARAKDSAALARLRAVLPDRTQFKLADAQLVIAREAGFESWPKLVKHVEQQELAAAQKAVREKNAGELRRLLAGSQYLQSVINSPALDFGQQAIHHLAGDVAMLDVLLDFGADPNAKSNWANGPFVPLDHANEASARHLISRGAVLTPNAAARLGWIEELRATLKDDAKAVHHRGGDGKQPLHEAKTVEIAKLLLEHGAEIDARCVDHQTTPAQYALGDRIDVCKFLIERGATADIFLAAKLADAALVKRLLRQDKSCANVRINFGGYPPVPPMHIYCWSLGWYKSPLVVAHEAGAQEALALLRDAADAKTQFIDGLMFNLPVNIDAIIASNPNMVETLQPQDHKLLAHAAHLRLDDAFQPMLAAGFDPNATALDGGTALHQAAWTGGAELVDLILKTGKCDLEQRDPTHGSTPLGWATHGSANCRHRKGDYERTVRLLVAAGAKMDVPANKFGTTFVQQAQGNPAIQALLRELGAT